MISSSSLFKCSLKKIRPTFHNFIVYHTVTHTHTHTRTHTHTHTLQSSLTQAYSLTQTPPAPFSNISLPHKWKTKKTPQKHTQNHTKTHTHTNTQMHTHAHKTQHTHTHPDSPTPTHTHPFSYTSTLLFCQVKSTPPPRKKTNSLL